MKYGMTRRFDALAAARVHLSVRCAHVSIFRMKERQRKATACEAGILAGSRFLRCTRRDIILGTIKANAGANASCTNFRISRNDWNYSAVSAADDVRAHVHPI